MCAASVCGSIWSHFAWYRATVWENAVGANIEEYIDWLQWTAFCTLRHKCVIWNCKFNFFPIPWADVSSVWASLPIWHRCGIARWYRKSRENVWFLLDFDLLYLAYGLIVLKFLVFGPVDCANFKNGALLAFQRNICSLCFCCSSPNSL